MNNQNYEILESAKELIKEEVTPISYITWIKPLEVENWTDNEVTFVTKTGFQSDVIENKYHDLIVNAFKILTNKEYTLKTHCLENEDTEDFTSNPTSNNFSNL